VDNPGSGPAWIPAVQESGDRPSGTPGNRRVYH